MLRFISDPGHGWLEVPIADVHASGISVSPYSYIDDTHYYLEEDCDCTAYMVAVNPDMEVDDLHLNLEAWIRDLDRVNDPTWASPFATHGPESAL